MFNRDVSGKLALLTTKIFDIESITLKKDHNFLIIDKPANILVHPSVDKARADLQTLVQMQYPDARLLHRLDFLTSGVLVFGLSTVAESLFKQADKWYMLAVTGQILEPFTSKLYLKEKNRKVQSVNSGGKVAITHFEPLAHQSGVTLLKAKLVTGRRHQIRVSMFEKNTPILGDSVYGGSNFNRLMLHAYQINFNTLNIKSRIPDEFQKLFPRFNFDTLD